MRFVDKVVVITGSSRNIGLTTARRFAAEGAKVVLNASSSAQELDRAAVALQAQGYDVHPVLANVGTEEGAQHLVDQAVETYGRLDVLVINHSVRPRQLFADMTTQQWHAVVDVNLHSAFYLCKAAVPLLTAAGNASIIAIGGESQSGTHSAPRAHAFAGLAGRTAMLQTLGAEIAPQGVRVNFVSPGAMDTVRMNPEWYPGAPPEGPQWSPDLLKSIPLGRPGTTDELASAILFLASDEASYIVGTTIRVAGGWG